MKEGLVIRKGDGHIRFLIFCPCERLCEARAGEQDRLKSDMPRAVSNAQPPRQERATVGLYIFQLRGKGAGVRREVVRGVSRELSAPRSMGPRRSPRRTARRSRCLLRTTQSSKSIVFQARIFQALNPTVFQAFRPIVFQTFKTFRPIVFQTFHPVYQFTTVCCVAGPGDCVSRA